MILYLDIAYKIIGILVGTAALVRFFDWLCNNFKKTLSNLKVFKITK